MFKSILLFTFAENIMRKCFMKKNRGKVSKLDETLAPPDPITDCLMLWCLSKLTKIFKLTSIKSKRIFQLS